MEETVGKVLIKECPKRVKFRGGSFTLKILAKRWYSGVTPERLTYLKLVEVEWRLVFLG